MKNKMPVLKKTAQILKRCMPLLIFLNLIFSATTLSLLYFAGRKIQTYMLMMYTYTPQLQDLESMLSENVNLEELDKLNEAIAVINQSYKMIFIITIVSLVIFFLIWCFFQSLQWRITYKSLKKKIKLEEIFDNHLKYALKFSLITVPAFIIIIPISYYLLANIKIFFLNLLIKTYGLAEPLSPINYVLLISLALLLLLITYFTILVYVLLNKEQKLIKSIGESFKLGIKKIHILLPIHFLALIVILPLIFLYFYLTTFLDFKIAVIISFLIYFVVIAYYQILMSSLLEKI